MRVSLVVPDQACELAGDQAGELAGDQAGDLAGDGQAGDLAGQLAGDLAKKGLKAMPLKVPDEGERKIMNILRDQWDAGAPPIFIRLYENNHVPADNDTVDSYVECKSPGYQQKPLDQWGAAATVGGKAVLEHPQVTWTFTGAGVQPLHGYYVTDAVNEILYWAEKFEQPVNVINGLQQNIVPKFSGSTEF